MRSGKSQTPFADRVARVWAGLSEIVRTADDPDVALAAFFQVTPAQLRAWRAAEGRHRCPVMTTRGHGCRGHASAVVDYDPRAWVSRDPAFCPAHAPARHESAAVGRDVPAATPQVPDRIAAAEDDEPHLAR